MVQFDLPHYVSNDGKPEKPKGQKGQTAHDHGHALGAAIAALPVTSLPDAAQKYVGGKRLNSRRQRQQQLQDFLRCHDFSEDVCAPRASSSGCFFLPKPRIYPIHVAAHLGDHEAVRSPTAFVVVFSC